MVLWEVTYAPIYHITVVVIDTLPPRAGVTMKSGHKQKPTALERQHLPQFAIANLPPPSFTVTDLQGTTYHFAANEFYLAPNPTTATPADIAYLYPNTIEDRNGNIITLTTGTNQIAGRFPYHRYGWATSSSGGPR